MNRLKKSLICAPVLAVVLSFFGPPILRNQVEKRQEIADGTRLIHRAFSRIERTPSGATLYAIPRYKRGYTILFAGETPSELLLGLDRFHDLVPMRVQLGSRFTFQFRHNACRFRVTKITRSGIEFEVGQASIWPRHPTTFLPFSAL